MKQSIRKLVVHKESIRTMRPLNDKELERVVGGESHDACTTLATIAPSSPPPVRPS